MAGATTAAPPPLAPSTHRHEDAGNARPQIASRPASSSRGGQDASLTSPAAAPSGSAPGRAPLPNRQPKATPGKAAVAPAALPCLSAPPPADKMTMAAVISPGPMQDASLTSPAAAPSGSAPGRAPLPNRQPKATPGKAAVAPAALPCLSAPPPADKMTMAAVISPGPMQDASLTSPAAAPSGSAPGRAPLPNRQPKATPGKAAVAPAALPCLSAPPPADKMTMAAVISPGPMQDASLTSPAAAPSGSAPGRAPLPNRQPKATPGKAAVAPAALPCLSAPPPADKMTMAAVISPGPMQEAPKMSMTSKEWVIPPRPKPGRKPATDTPPTKRKAQNRAAQRAFRERRAARVGELEIQLDEVRETHEKQEAELKEKIHGLELDLQSFRSRCMLLENMLDRERQERIRAETQAETLKRRHDEDFFRPSSMSGPHRHAHSQPHSPTHHSQRHSMSDGRQLQNVGGRNFSISQIITPPESMDVHSQHDDVDAPLTCGNCSPTGPCACAEEVLASAGSGCGKCGFGAPCQCLGEMESVVSNGQDLKRPLSPSNPSSNGKRHRSNAGPSVETETDFTALFSKRMAATSVQPSPYQMAPSDPQMPSANSIPFKDSCGFCKDGTYCMCAEDAAMATPAMTPTAETLPPMSHQTQTPPPSEPDVHPQPLFMEMTADGAVKLPRRTQPKPHKKPTKTDSRGCGANGPGTCAQCQADPKSGLFCRLMSAKFDREKGASSGGGCCGGKGAGGGCCKSGPEKEKITLPSLPSLGLSCAEAYQTLSSHRNFDRAADDISSWLPKLKATTPNGSVRAGPHRGRQAIEVEAASIMSVLKEFDVRFGREC